MIYTIRNGCVEVPDMPYDDGAKTLFFYTKGTKGNPSKELKEFLHYMEETTLENAKNNTLREIQTMVESVKREGTVSLEYMRIMKSRAELRDELLDEIWEEEQAKIQEVEKRAEAEKKRAETEKQRAEAEKQRAETEKRRAETEKRRAETEKRRAERAEAELERIRKEFFKMQGKATV